MPKTQSAPTELATVMDGVTVGKLILQLGHQNLQHLIEIVVATVRSTEHYERSDETVG